MKSRFLLCLPLILAACGSDTASRPPPPAVTAAAPQTVNGAYVVQPGDSIYSIAREQHVSVRSLIDTNQLKPPFQLLAGQRLLLPGSGFYVVGKGESLSVIAHKTGVAFSTLARINGLTSPYVLQVGQRLLLPTSSIPAAAAPTSTASTAPPLSGKPTIAPPQPIPAPAGTVVTSPSGAVAPPSAPTSAPASAPASAPSGAPSSAANGIAPGLPPVATAAASPPAPPPTPLPPPPAQSGRGFIWPLKGEVIAEFGTTGKGQHNDGVNIAAPRGTTVQAAESGVVAYAGNELRGFGNLLLIKHDNGWMTAYAHNDSLAVKRGDIVKRGQKIAVVGDSGGVAQPQLHFEVRQGTRAVDPASVIGGKTLPVNGAAEPADQG